MAGSWTQGPGEGDLEALAFGEPLGPAIGELAHVEAVEEDVDALFQAAAVEAMQAAEITDVLARRQAGIQAPGVGEGADAALGGQAVGDRIQAVDAGGAPIRAHDGIEDAQRRRLAGAVGADQGGDLAVAGGEAQSVEGMHGAEGFS